MIVKEGGGWLAVDRDTVVLGAMHGLRRGTDVTVLAPVIGTQAAFGAPPSRRETDHFDLGDVSVTVRQRLHHARPIDEHLSARPNFPP